jgi:RNA polymerase sigma-70 factor, ECF subfamily
MPVSNVAVSHRRQQGEGLSGETACGQTRGAQTVLSLQAENPETGLALDPPDTLPAPDELAMNAEQMAQVRESLDQLDESCREIVELRYLGDLSYDELGATLKLNPKTVSSRLSRCLDRLEQIARKTFLRDKPGVFPSN